MVHLCRLKGTGKDSDSWVSVKSLKGGPECQVKGRGFPADSVFKDIGLRISI